MVNKCSAIGCKSLYIKPGKNVKLHRFPLTNNETLPAWIAATGRDGEWKPCKSSRLCGNHFQRSEYIVGHGKGVLKSTAIPTIDYRIDIPKYQKKKYLISHTSKLIKVEHTENDKEIDQLNYNDDYAESYHTEEYGEPQNDQKIINNSTTIKLENVEKSIEQIRKELCNRDNQCLFFTSNFKKEEDDDDHHHHPVTSTPPHEVSFIETPSMFQHIDLSTADSNFNRIMALKMKKRRRTKDVYSLYFRSMAKNVVRSETVPSNIPEDETAAFGAFVAAQMKSLLPNKHVYLATKHKIQKLLMKAQLKINGQSI